MSCCGGVATEMRRMCAVCEQKVQHVCCEQRRKKWQVLEGERREYEITRIDEHFEIYTVNKKW